MRGGGEKGKKNSEKIQKSKNRKYEIFVLVVLKNNKDKIDLI